MHRNSLPIGIIAFTTTLACTSPPHDSVTESLLAVDRAFDSVVAERGVEGWVSFFADSGIQMPEGSGIVIGHDAIRRHMSGFFSDTKQKLRWVLALVEEWMPGRPIAVKTLKIELWAARIVQLGRIGVRFQDGPVCRNVVSDKLPKDWPASSGIAQRLRRVFDVSAIA